MSNHEELKAHIEHVKRILRFYTLYGGEVVRDGFSRRELEKLIDIQLDKLIELLRQLKD
ncbi:hypothetical protein [Bacteroides sp. 224]|uniref:hypothetical protein n=1 Tax=Bacteroides sp. 224 TaxID=2302936 RepID=UPI001EF175A3|nr:hypothetical protein [Bacteroides sp. 224]